MAWLLPPWFKRDGVNGALLTAWERALKGADPEGAAALLRLEEAYGPYLDLHGALYGVRRLPDEPDDAYRLRILAEVRHPRSTEEALERALEAAFPGLRARVYTLVGSGELVWLDGTRQLDGSWALGGGATYPVLLNGACRLDGSFDLGGGRSYPRPRPLTGEWNLDGTWRLGLAYHPPHANRFLVEVGAAEVDLSAVLAVVDRFRAAGNIPTVRATVEWTPDWPGVVGKVISQQVVPLDGTRRLDGSWTLAPVPTGEDPL